MSADLLREMHTYCRPHGSETEQQFVAAYILPIGDVSRDAHGNYHHVIPNADGSLSRIMWACHTDTVHRAQGRQTVHLSATGRLSLHRRERKRTRTETHTYKDKDGHPFTRTWPVPRRNCLGADDTVGVYLLCEMARARVPGHYVWHYGEEAGCIGSANLANEYPEWLQAIDICVSLDRADRHEVITHQCGTRTASDLFAQSFADALNTDRALTYAPSDRGVFTDSEAYKEIIPECTNIGVGYFGQHDHGEYVDTCHVARLRNRLIAMDHDALLVDRDPTVDDDYLWTRGTNSGNLWDGDYRDTESYVGVHDSDDTHDDLEFYNGIYLTCERAALARYHDRRQEDTDRDADDHTYSELRTTLERQAEYLARQWRIYRGERKG